MFVWLLVQRVELTYSPRHQPRAVVREYTNRPIWACSRVSRVQQRQQSPPRCSPLQCRTGNWAYIIIQVA